MRLLLDTHTFLWWDTAPEKLSKTALALCRDPSNILLLSVASIWEMQIKFQLGKLSLALPLRQIVMDHQQSNRIEILPIAVEHILALQDLPSHHRDPFDRLLAAQAIVENAVFVSSDPVFRRYPVTVRW